MWSPFYGDLITILCDHHFMWSSFYVITILCDPHFMSIPCDPHFMVFTILCDPHFTRFKFHVIFISRNLYFMWSISRELLSTFHEINTSCDRNFLWSSFHVISISWDLQFFEGGPGLHFWKHDFELWDMGWGDGIMDFCQLLEGGFSSMRAAKKCVKNQKS